MVFKSNMLLRQKSSKVQMKKHSSISKKILLSPQDEEMMLEKEENEMVELIQSNEPDEAENGVEYVTVILANDYSTESDGDDEIIEDPNEMTAQDEVYDVSEDTYDGIPKMSLRNYRSRRRIKDGDNKSLTCNECGKTLSNFSSYKYHMQLHSEETPFLCSECGEGFKTRNAYDGHLVTHMESNPNKCEICGKSYRQAASLRSHMFTHTGEKVVKFKLSNHLNNRCEYFISSDNQKIFYVPLFKEMCYSFGIRNALSSILDMKLSVLSNSIFERR